MAVAPVLRRVANASWDVGKYEAVLGSALDAEPGSLSSRFGPFVTGATQVSAIVLLRALPLLDALLVAGQSSGVLHGQRVETALLSLLSRRPLLLGSAEVPLRVAHAFTDHLLAVLKALRTMKRENEVADTSRWARRYPNSGVARPQTC